MGLPRRRGRLVLTVLAAAAALAACATPQTGDAAETTPPQTVGAGAATPPPTGARGYDCNGRPVDPVAFAAARPAATLPAEQLAIVESAMDDAGRPIGLDTDQWIVVASADDQIDLMRPVNRGEPALDAGHDWEHIVIGVLGSAGWMVTSWSTCALSYDPSPLTAAEVSLDPATPPDPSSRDLALLVTERACNGGQGAEGRVRLVELVETADTVTVMIGVDRTGMDGQYTCPSNPPTPFTVTLAEPLGGRAIVNGNLVEARPIELPGPAH